MKKLKVILVILVLLLLSSCAMKASDGYIDYTVTETESVLQTVPETTEEETTEKTTEKTDVFISPEEADKYVAFSFDDGPGTYSTDKILDQLEKYDYTATFFVVGVNINDNSAKRIKRAYDMGCEIGNHTWSHTLKLNSQSQSEVDSEISKTNNKVESITGEKPTLVRFPGGLFSKLNVNVGSPIINWTIDTNDWRKKGNAGNKEAASNLADYIIGQIENNPGSIVLMHDVYDFSAETVEIVMAELNEMGYKVVSVSRLAEIRGVTLEANTVYSRF